MWLLLNSFFVQIKSSQKPTGRCHWLLIGQWLHKRILSGYAVVVQFYPWFKFYFPLFLDMVMYDNEFETKENKIKPRIKLNNNSYTVGLLAVNPISMCSKTALTMRYSV